MAIWTGVAVGLLVVLLGLVVVLVTAMRTKNPRVLGVVRRFNRRYNNPRMLRVAGRAGSQLDAIRHVGRSSGRSYTTPIGALAMGDDFLALMSYGTDTDWLRNVRAAGSAELLKDGRTYRVTPGPVVGQAEAMPYVPKGQVPFVRLFGITQFLVLHPAPSASDEARAQD